MALADRLRCMIGLCPVEALHQAAAFLAPGLAWGGAGVPLNGLLNRLSLFEKGYA